MNDPKPATPATPCVLSCGDFEYGQHAPHCPNYQEIEPGFLFERDAMLARIAADAEIIKAQAQELDIAKGTIQKLRESSITDPGECDETVDRIAAVEWARNGRFVNRCQLQNAAMVILALDAESKAQSSEIELLVQIGETTISNLATLREQVRVLREALETARKIIYAKTWDTDQHALNAIAAALAATEPKG